MHTGVADSALFTRLSAKLSLFYASYPSLGGEESVARGGGQGWREEIIAARNPKDCCHK